MSVTVIQSLKLLNDNFNRIRQLNLRYHRRWKRLFFLGVQDFNNHLILDITGGPELQILETGDTFSYLVPIAARVQRNA